MLINKGIGNMQTNDARSNQYIIYHLLAVIKKKNEPIGIKSTADGQGT